LILGPLYHVLAPGPLRAAFEQPQPLPEAELQTCAGAPNNTSTPHSARSCLKSWWC